MTIRAWVGGVTGSGVAVRAYDDAAALTELTLRVSTAPDLTGATPVPGALGPGGVFSFVVGGLRPDTRYHYGFDSAPAHGQFRTLPNGPASFTIAAGGDSGLSPQYLGAINTSDSIAFDRIRERDPLLFLHLGDLHYRNNNQPDSGPYRTAYRDVMANDRFAQLVANVPTDYTWDDHDFCESDGDGASVGRPFAQAVYREHVPHYPLPGPDGEIYHAFTVGRVRFIQIDNRSDRTPNEVVDGPSKTRLGAVQKAWLKAQLLSATEPLIVLNVGTWIGHTSHVDGWDAHATERAELFDFLAANRLMERILLIGADLHELVVDDGTNTNLGTDPIVPGPPYIGLAPLDSTFTPEITRTAQHTYAVSRQQYGTLDFDDDGTAITVTVRGWACFADDSEDLVFTFERTFPSLAPDPEPGGPIEAWVTTPAGEYIAHLDRSAVSPFRGFSFYRERPLDGPGGGSLEYHLDNALVRELAAGREAIAERSFRAATLALPDLVAYWRLATLEDEGPGSFDLTQVGSPTLAAGLLTGDPDGAQHFPGADTDYFQTPALPALGVAFSIGAWIEPDIDDAGIFLSGGASRPYLRHLNSDITMAFTDAGGAQVTFSSTGDAAPIGGRLFVVGTHDGTHGRLYVNGVEVASSAIASQAPGAMTFRIGRWGAAGLPFTGVIDEPFIVNRALTAAEIIALHEAGNEAPQASVAAVPPVDLFAKGNLVWMRYRGRTVAWVVEEDTRGLDRGEADADWTLVAGAGALQLLADRIVFPPEFADGANLDPKTWSTQWREAVNVAAGELLWALIDESNARFATQILRGVIETSGSDGVTVRHRFENLLVDVVEPVLGLYGGFVDMNGLTFSYYARHGVDRRNEVIFEEGADIDRLTVIASESEALSFVVGEGVGEGVFAKLAVAEDDTVARRREAFVAAKEAANLPLLQFMTDAALAENGPALGLELSVSETRYRALLDYDLDDVVRVVAPSRGVDESIEVVAIYVSESGDRIAVDVDLGLVREDDDLRHDRQLRQTRQQLGVRNRQPQGQLVPYPIMGQGFVDTGHPFRLDFLVPDSIFVLVRTQVQISFSEFTAPATAASSGGGATSGASSAASSASGGGSTPTSSTEAPHTHQMFDWVSNTPGALTKRKYSSRNQSGAFFMYVNLETEIQADVHTYSADGSHSHTVAIGGHTHSIAHTHDVPAHVHGLDYGIFEEAMPAAIDAVVGVYKRNGASWDLVASISGLTDEVEDVDLTPWVDSAGSWRLAIESAPGAPQGGRLAVSVAGSIEGAIQSA